MVGSACFALGSVPWYAGAVGAHADGVTYFVGSIFFTSAALMQVLLSAGVIQPDERPRAGVQWRRRVRSVDRPEWWAGLVQFAGTIMFNVSTWFAMSTTLDATEAERRVWTPDVRGSIAFLIASALAFADVDRPWLTWRPRDLGWSVATLNLVGSVAFGVSALAAWVNPTTGDVLAARLDSLGTLVGAICFFVGALLLIPDQAGSARTHDGTEGTEGTDGSVARTPPPR
jgi:hypothetical protein